MKKKKRRVVVLLANFGTCINKKHKHYVFNRKELLQK